MLDEKQAAAGQSIARSTSIWIDADACPKACRDILCRAGQRTATPLIFVSNHPLPLRTGPLLQWIRVQQGFDQADHTIEMRIWASDLLITQDIPLAAAVIAKGALVLTPRGEILDKNNISQRLTLRNLQEELRNAGQFTGGPAAFDQKNKQLFGNALDQWLQKKKSG